MSYFKGRCKMNELFSHIVNDFKTTTGSNWSVYYESLDKFVIRSLGSSGADRLFIILEPGDTLDPKGSYLKISIADSVSTVDGSVPDGFIQHSKDVYLHSADVDTNLLVDYEVSITADRAIVYLQGDVNSATGLSVLGYFGLMSRYSVEANSDALCVGISYQGDNGVRTIRDLQNKQVNNIYDSYSTILPVNPGWGNLYHMSPCILGNPSEGARGELIDVFFIPTAGVSHGDEIRVGTKIYRVYSLTVGGQSFLPGSTVAVQMI